MKRLILAALITLVAGLAFADVTVEITSTDPSDGTISNGESAKINWKIDTTASESGTYQVEVGGDGTPGSGEIASSDDATGDFSGSETTGSTTIVAKDDLTDGDGDYTIYVIAIFDVQGEQNSVFASTTIKLDNPPQKPEGFSVGSGEGRLFLNWNAPEDRDIKKVHIGYDTKSHTNADVTIDDYKGTGAKNGNSPIEIEYKENTYILKGLKNGTKYYLRIVFEDEGDKVGEISNERSQMPQEVSGLADLTGEKGGCFIATTLFGEDHFVTKTLRALRDKFLIKFDITRALVKLYYRYGPALASYISSKPALKVVFKALFIPLAIVIAPMVGTASAWPYIISAAMIGSIAFALVVWRRR